jgi:lysophospholipase L1-like esterase
MVLGGSNSGAKGGWAHVLKGLVKEHHVDNKFLGAVGSLFGLLRLLKLDYDNSPKPDVVIFEYTLNDSLWHAGGAISLQMIEKTLHDVITYCARHRIKLLFLCLCVRPVNEGAGESEGSLFIDDLYRSVARLRGVSDCLFQANILGQVCFEQYTDPLHLSQESAAQVASAVAARLRRAILIPNGSWRRIAFSYIDAMKAQIEDQASIINIVSSVFEGPFVELRRGGVVRWRTGGRLMAVMVRSTEQSGLYRIRAGKEAVRKNAQSVARDKVANLLTLHYVLKEFKDHSDIVIDLPVEEECLMGLPNDPTLMECPPLTRLETQSLQINGILIYYRDGTISRLLEWIIVKIS